jgi:flagellar motor switch protein FliM
MLDVNVYLAGTDISVRDMLELYPGQVLVTEKPVAAPLMLTVAGKPKFMGRAGTYRGKKAFQILRAARPEDRL